MFSSAGKSKQSESKADSRLATTNTNSKSPATTTTTKAPTRKLSGQTNASLMNEEDERESFLLATSGSRQRLAAGSGGNKSGSASKLAAQNYSNNKQKQHQKKAKLARAETIEEQDRGCLRMLCGRLMKRKWLLLLLVVISCIAAIYCIPYIELNVGTTKQLPHIPFNFRDGPLRPSSYSQFKSEKLFVNQISGAESIALDSNSNMYLAIEGGYILYAHLNSSSSPNRLFYEAGGKMIGPTERQQRQYQQQFNLVKIAELNGIRQVTYARQRQARDGGASEGSWKRECELDDKIYGSTANLSPQQQQQSANDIDGPKKFVSNVFISRCSKPLGIRLSLDENYLYVIDTLSGLYRVSLKVSERPHSSQRLVMKLIEFRSNQILPIIHLDLAHQNQNQNQQQQQQHQQSGQVNLSSFNAPVATTRARAFMNVTFRAVDDLAIDFGAGSRGGDLIYMTVASQSWEATSFMYDLLEGRPSGLVLRYDTGSNQLGVLSPSQVAHVRYSILDPNNVSSAPTSSRSYSTDTSVNNNNNNNNNQLDLPYLGIGAPRLDENDVFDDRPLHFANGIELTDDRQALLIADTANKRIIKHHISGPRRGSSDLWAWTPNWPDNIRRGFDKRHETYWVAGCGEDATNKKIDLLDWLHGWPVLRKFILKNFYLFGWLIESFGANIMKSTSIRDFGYSIKTGHTMCHSFCAGMMVLQYNKHGDIIRSIHSKEFPSDLALYSQVNEVIDAQNQEHILYLSSPFYSYVTKLILPTDSFDYPPSSTMSTL